MVDVDWTWRYFQLAWRRSRHIAFVSGLGMSGLAVLIFVLSAYFAGTAPHLPSTTALETLKTGESWPSPVRLHTLDTRAAPSSAQASPASISTLPRATVLSDAPPIDISDPPPRAQRIR